MHHLSSHPISLPFVPFSTHALVKCRECLGGSLEHVVGKSFTLRRRFSRGAIPILLAGLSVSLLGIGSLRAEDPPVAVVDGVEIKKSELDNLIIRDLQGGSIESLPAEQRTLIRERMLDGLIAERLIDKASKDFQISESEVEREFQGVVDQVGDVEQLKEQLAPFNRSLDDLKADIRKSLRQRGWVEQQIASKTAVSEEEAKAFYEANPEASQRPESVRASHILLLTNQGKSDAEQLEAISALRSQIVSGEDFSLLAKQHSEDPGSKDLGGDLNYFQRGMMVPEFEEAAFNLEIDQVSGPVKTEYGYHLIKVTDKKEAEKLPFDSIKERIQSYLSDQGRQDAVEALVKDLRDKADVKVLLK